MKKNLQSQLRYCVGLLALLLVIPALASAEFEEVLATLPSHVIAEAITEECHLIPLVVEKKSSEHRLFAAFVDRVLNIDDFEGDPAMYFITHLNLSLMEITRRLDKDVSLENLFFCARC